MILTARQQDMDHSIGINVKDFKISSALGVTSAMYLELLEAGPEKNTL